MSEPHVIAQLPKNSRETLRVSLDEYRGHNLINVRVCVPLSETSGILAPTMAGVSLSIAMLPALSQALIRAEEAAREKGWLE